MNYVQIDIEIIFSLYVYNQAIDDLFYSGLILVKPYGRVFSPLRTENCSGLYLFEQYGWNCHYCRGISRYVGG